MTVKEVIDALWNYPSEMEVWFDVEHAYSEVGSIKKRMHPYPKDNPINESKEIIMISF